MRYINWVEENGAPYILGFIEKVFPSTDAVHHHTPRQFEKIVGRGNAREALQRYANELRQ